MGPVPRLHRRPGTGVPYRALTQIEQLLKGFTVSWLPEQWRDYLVWKRTGRFRSEWQDVPALEVDWMLAIDDVVEGVRRG